jgi:hypothetical protein
MSFIDRNPSTPEERYVRLTPYPSAAIEARVIRFFYLLETPDKRPRRGFRVLTGKVV